MKSALDMSSYDFYKEVFHPRATVLTAIGGCIAGRFYGIPPIHGAVYAVTSRSVGQAALLINEVVLEKSCETLSKLKIKKSFIKLVLTPLMMANVYLVFTASNKAPSLIGKPLIFATAAKVSLVSGITGFFSGLLINYMRR